MSKKLEGKIAVVTGGSRGIGAAIAKRLAADGARVAMTSSKGADAAAVKAAVETTVATFGGFDVLVNNAGTAIPNRFEEATLDELDRVIDINIRGTFVATQAALKYMNYGGRIIMIGSCVGERTMTPGLVPHAATKGAVKMFRRGCPGRWGTGASRSITSSPARSIRN